MEKSSLLELKKAINDLACKLGDVPATSLNKRKIADSLLGDFIAKKAYGKSFYEISKKVKEETGVMIYSSRVIEYMSDLEREQLTVALSILTDYVNSKYQASHKQVYENICERAKDIGVCFKDVLRPNLSNLLKNMIESTKQRKRYEIYLEESTKDPTKEVFLQEQERFFRLENKLYHDLDVSEEELLEALTMDDILNTKGKNR